MMPPCFPGAGLPLAPPMSEKGSTDEEDIESAISKGSKPTGKRNRVSEQFLEVSRKRKKGRFSKIDFMGDISGSTQRFFHFFS